MFSHPPPQNQRDRVRAERNLLSEFDVQTPWVVSLEATFQDKDNLYMLMEYLPGGDLTSYLARLKVDMEKSLLKFRDILNF